MSAIRTDFSGETCQGCKDLNSRPKRCGHCLSNAASTYVQNSCGSLSPSSRESQATRDWEVCSERSQVERAVVLPKPAGAETSVRGRLRLSLSRVSRRGRVTRG